MKRIVNTICLFALGVSFSSCDYLNRDSGDNLTADEVFSRIETAESYINNAYIFLPDYMCDTEDYAGRYNIGCCTDELGFQQQTNYGTQSPFGINMGSWSPSSMPLQKSWEEYFQCIRRCNMLIKYYDLIPEEISSSGINRKERLLGEAYGLRGYFYWLLFRMWGGVPLIKSVVDPGDESQMSGIERATAESTVNSIVDDLKMAASLLPVAQDDANFGRMTKLVATVAISQVKLFWASPLWNPEGGVDYDTRWQDAAEACSAALKLAEESGKTLATSYDDLFSNSISTEYIWVKNAILSECFWWDYYHFPTGFGGAYNVEGPLQEMIDAFEMNQSGERPVLGYKEDNTPILNALATDYKTETPWEGRDPRFYYCIMHHNDYLQGEYIDTSEGSGTRYGHDKSYHAGGSHKSFFGAIWPSEDFGMLHYALRDEKLGRKYFSWSQSCEGSIWIDLLTDTRPQYVELQSGRLFNQNLPGSEKTPYKQTLFSPYGTDEWNEYWMPFSGLKKVDEVTPLAAVETGEGKVVFYTVSRMNGEMQFIDGNGRVFERVLVDWEPARTVSKTIDTDALAKITFNGSKLWSAESQNIDRPRDINPHYSESSAQGLTVQAYYNAGTRKYALAQEKVDAALALDPALIPALNIKALLSYRSMSYEEAYQYASKVLAIDQYNAEANYIGGLAAVSLGKIVDAMDHFEIAAITSELRSASCTALSKLHFKEGDLNLARNYICKSLVGNAHNLAAYQLLYQIEPSEEVLGIIDRLDPLCHFRSFEQMLEGKISAEELANSIKEEMRWQDYMEYAVFCNNLGLCDKALRTLDACPDKNALIELWKAYIKNDASLIASAEKASVDFVFPFRQESAPVLEWAVANKGGWVSNYLLAILNDHLCNTDRARAIVSGIECNYAPFYSYRATLTSSVDDMKKAMALDKEQWRYVQNLAMHYYFNKEYKASLAIVEPYYRAHKSNFRIGDTYVKNLIAIGQFSKAEKEMAKLDIIPFEGQSATRIMYRDIKLHLAAQNIDNGKYKVAAEKVAQARLWPEQFGVGKPYDDLVDTKIEDMLMAVILKRQGKTEESEAYVKKVLAADPGFNVNSYLEARGIVALLETRDSTGDKKLF